MKVINTMFSWYIRQRLPHIKRYVNYPLEVQSIIFQELIKNAANTEWGRKYQYAKIKTAEEFQAQVPISRYEDIFPYIERMMHGESDVLWPGKVAWFSKSSGTTNGKSKFIPVTEVNLKECHLRGGHDVITSWYGNNNARLLEGKNLTIGGCYDVFEGFKETRIGDVSAIMMDHMPGYVKLFNTPDVQTALMKNFDEKLERMAQLASKENVTIMAGVPTWVLVLARRILEITGKDNLLEVWPNFEVYIHGGVHFNPYREQFKALLPAENVGYVNIYNASEGFFAAQLDNIAEEGEMTLMLDNGIYYEFLPATEWHKEHPKAIPLEAVEVGQNYALIISTNAGLWRYMPGDTVAFTAVFPFKIKVTGRIKHYINVFGEEVMIENTDKALAKTCLETKAQISEYTVAPIFLSTKQKGGHEWIIEFEKAPPSLAKFTELLDKNLQDINSDYEAKRYKDLALVLPVVHQVPEGTFHNWLRAKGRYGGQSKVPRLSNERTYLEEILDFSVQKI